MRPCLESETRGGCSIRFERDAGISQLTFQSAQPGIAALLVSNAIVRHWENFCKRRFPSGLHNFFSLRRLVKSALGLRSVMSRAVEAEEKNSLKSSHTCQTVRGRRVGRLLKFFSSEIALIDETYRSCHRSDVSLANGAR